MRVGNFGVLLPTDSGPLDTAGSAAVASEENGDAFAALSGELENHRRYHRRKRIAS
jgi:hypothetical protein